MTVLVDSKQKNSKRLVSSAPSMTVTGEFYPEMEQAIQDISNRLYEIATGKWSKICRSSAVEKSIKHFEIFKPFFESDSV